MTIIRMNTGTREERVAKAQQIKAAMQKELPELLALRRQLIDAGMMADNFSSIARVLTEDVDYDKERDDPLYYVKRSRKPAITNEEIDRDVQTRQQHPFDAADLVRRARESARRR